MDKQVVNIGNLKSSEKSKNSSGDLNNKHDYKSLLSKIFTKKNIKILALIIIGVFALILFMGIGGESEEKTDSVSGNKIYTSTLEYCAELENKLEKVLSGISGAGNVRVMVSVDGSPELVYATNADNKTSSTSNGSTVTTSSNPIIVESNGNANPLILTENLPEVKGVIVVSSGAGDVSIKLDILNAVSTLLNISTDKISVLKGI